MVITVVVHTCDKLSWLIPPFSYLFNTYWSGEQPVAYGGCEQLDLPPNFYWYPVESRIAGRWSDGFIELLNMVNAPIIAWLLGDYFLSRGVDHAAIGSLADYMMIHPDILKMDLTSDRLHSGRAVDIDTWGRFDIIETDWDTPYNYSTQAALWNRKNLLSILKPEQSPWDFELHTEHHPEFRVTGTRNRPVNYVNAAGMGLDSKYRYRTEHIREGLGGKTIERIPKEHIDRMLELGILPPQEK